MSFAKWINAIAGAALAVALSASAGFAQACGGDYKVRPGDSLAKIARKFYDDTDAFQFIFNANAAAIGANPSLIEIGQRLFIPCLDDIQASRADTSAIAGVTGPAPLPAPDAAKVRLLTASGWGWVRW